MPDPNRPGRAREDIAPEHGRRLVLECARPDCEPAAIVDPRPLFGLSRAWCEGRSSRFVCRCSSRDTRVSHTQNAQHAEPTCVSHGATPLVLTGPIPLADGRALPLRVMGRRLCAGFPSPADDYLEEALDPARLIVTNPAATFMWRIAGASMIGAGINDGDFVVVDRSLSPKAGDCVVAVIDGQPSAKKVIRLRGGRLALDFDNPAMTQLLLDEAAEALIWGVITWSLTPHRTPSR